MPANSRWDLIRRLRVKMLAKKTSYSAPVQAISYLYTSRMTLIHLWRSLFVIFSLSSVQQRE